MNAEVRATACWYPTDIHKGTLGQGQKDNSLARVSEISGEMLMILGRQDPHVSQEGRRLIYEAMTRAGLLFTRDEGSRYDPAVARICYGLALEMFHRRLGEGDRHT